MIQPPNDTLFWVRLTVIYLTIAVAVFDLILLGRYGREGTISYIIAEACREFPILPYAISFAFGGFVFHIIQMARQMP